MDTDKRIVVKTTEDKVIYENYVSGNISLNELPKIGGIIKIFPRYARVNNQSPLDLNSSYVVENIFDKINEIVILVRRSECKMRTLIIEENGTIIKRFPILTTFHFPRPGDKIRLIENGKLYTVKRLKSMSLDQTKMYVESNNN